MSKETKYEGSTVRITGDFDDPDTDLPVDPVDLSIKVQAPDGTVETTTYPDAAIERTSTGRYFLKLLLAQSGTYHWKWVAQNGSDAGVVIPGSLESASRGDF
jgi:hypothetical protein